MKILALKNRRLGDTVLWTSALQALREFFNSATIDLAFPGEYGALFSHDPRFGSENLRLASSRSLRLRQALNMRRRRYDWVLNFHASSGTTMFSALVGAKKRIIHHHSRRANNSFSDSRVIDLGRVMAANERDLNVVRTLGWSGPPPRTKIFPPPFSIEMAEQKLRNLGFGQGEPLILMGMEASRPSKQWAFERYLELAKDLSRRGRVGLVYPARFPAPHFEREFSRFSFFLPTPGLEDLMGYLQHASCYVGSDSGVKHLACALEVPTVTLFGPESLGEWHFYPRDKNPVIQKKVLCRNNDPETPGFEWCDADICPLSSHACMNLISAEAVSLEVARVLSCGPLNS
jgi:ADP-heptose:LPS heptosyltransferase